MLQIKGIDIFWSFVEHEKIEKIDIIRYVHEFV